MNQSIKVFRNICILNTIFGVLKCICLMSQFGFVTYLNSVNNKLLIIDVVTTELYQVIKFNIDNK